MFEIVIWEVRKASIKLLEVDNFNNYNGANLLVVSVARI